MTFLPIVARELRVAARRPSTYWLRSSAALSLLLAGTWVVLVARLAPREIGMILFGILTGSATLFCLLSGVRSTADCLSMEKREGTLGLLFLTDLKGHDVVLGKLAATSVNAIYGVLAMVPMLAVPLLMGGVAPAEFGRMALVAVNTLFFSLSLGICVSAMSRLARKAMAMTFALLLLLTAGLPAIGASLAWHHNVRRLGLAFLVPSPGYAYATAFDTLYITNKAGFWTSLALIHGLAWVCLGAASIIAPRAWQDRPPGVQKLRWRERWQLWSYGDAVERSAYRRGLLSRNAYYWLAARERLKPAYVWSVLGLLGCGWVWGVSKYHRDWLNGGVYFITALMLNVLLKGWFATEAGRQLVEDRQQGALELLLSTPLTVREILRGQLLALRRQFLGPTLAVLIVFLICLLATLRELTDADERAGFICLYGGAMVMLVADLAALYWVGMWQGLTAANAHRATSNSMSRILVLPWCGLALAALVVSLASIRGQYDPGWKLAFAGWLGFGLMTDLIFALWARDQLLTAFRLAAARRFEPRPPLWKRLLVGEVH